MNLTIHTFTTPDKENFTVEFQWTEEQVQRARALQGNWQRRKLQLDVSGEITVRELVSTVSRQINAPRHDNEGERICYIIRKLPRNDILESNLLQSRPVMAAWLNGLGQHVDEDKTLSELADESESDFLFCPGLCAGGPDPLTVAASVATLAQLVLMFSDMWGKRKGSTKREGKGSKATAQLRNVREIRVCMDDGSWIYLNEVNCSLAGKLIENFSRSGASAKPRYAVIVLASGKKVKLQLLTEVDQENFAEFLDSIEAEAGQRRPTKGLKRTLGGAA